MRFDEIDWIGTVSHEGPDTRTRTLDPPDTQLPDWLQKYADRVEGTGLPYALSPPAHVSEVPCGSRYTLESGQHREEKIASAIQGEVREKTDPHIEADPPPAVAFVSFGTRLPRQ